MKQITEYIPILTVSDMAKSHYSKHKSPRFSTRQIYIRRSKLFRSTNLLLEVLISLRRLQDTGRSLIAEQLRLVTLWVGLAESAAQPLCQDLKYSNSGIYRKRRRVSPLRQRLTVVYFSSRHQGPIPLTFPVSLLFGDPNTYLLEQSN